MPKNNIGGKRTKSSKSMANADKLKVLKHRLAVNMTSAGRRDKKEIERLRAEIETLENKKASTLKVGKITFKKGDKFEINAGARTGSNVKGGFEVVEVNKDNVKVKALYVNSQDFVLPKKLITFTKEEIKERADIITKIRRK